MKQPDPIERLLEDLQSTDASLRKTAAEDLGWRVPAKLRTIQALHLAAQADTNEAVRSAAAKSFSDLTGAEPPQAPNETTATVIEERSAQNPARKVDANGKPAAEAYRIGLFFGLFVNTAAICISVFPPVLNRAAVPWGAVWVVLILNIAAAIVLYKIQPNMFLGLLTSLLVVGLLSGVLLVSISAFMCGAYHSYIPPNYTCDFGRLTPLH